MAVLRYVALFFLGSTACWLLEVLFRRFVHKKWCNPGFLAGPCLPLYGSALCVLYFICGSDFAFISNAVWRHLFVVTLLTLLMTLTEYLTGLYFLKKNHVRLWDYSKRPGNVDGLICPLFTFFWMVLSALYYFFAHRLMTAFTQWFATRPLLLFPLGIACGIFLVDLGYSCHILSKLKKLAKENKMVIRYEELKQTIRERARSRREKLAFLPFHSRHGLQNEFTGYLKRFRKKNADAEKNDAPDEK